MGKKALRSGPNGWKRSDPRPEEICTRWTESSQQVPKETAGGCGIRIAALNVWLERAGGQETALRTLRKGRIGIASLKEMKLIGDIHTQWSSGYTVWVVEAEIWNRGGVAIVWRDTEE